MTTLSHQAARQAAQQAADNRLDAAAQAALDEHLGACPECRAYAAELSAVEQGLRRALIERWEAPAARGPAPDLMQRITRAGGPQPMRTNRLDWIGRAAGVLAVLALVLALIFTLQLQPEPFAPAAGGTDAQGLPGTPDESPTPLPPPTRHFEPLPTTYSVQADFPGLGTLTGYAVTPIGAATLNIYTVWHAPAVPALDYTLSVQLEDGAGQLVAQSDSSPASHRPTAQWQAGEYAEVPLWLALPADLPPGDYTLYALAVDPQTGQRVSPASGDLAGDRVRLGVFQLLLNATVTATPADWLPPGVDCAAVACTPTPVLCYGHCPGAVFDVTVPPCDPAVFVCPEPTATPLPFPTFTPCQVGCGDGTLTPTPLPPPVGTTYYTVQPGDTCGSLVESFGAPVEVLVLLNPGFDCSLAVGQVLVVPLALTAPPPAAPGQPVLYTVQDGDTCQGIADRFGLPLEVLLAANNLSDCLSITVGWVLAIPLAPAPSATPCLAGCPETPTPPPPLPTIAPTVPPRPT